MSCMITSEKLPWLSFTFFVGWLGGISSLPCFFCCNAAVAQRYAWCADGDDRRITRVFYIIFTGRYYYGIDRYWMDFVHILLYAWTVEAVTDELSQAKHVSSLRIPFNSLQKALDPITKIQQENSDRLTALQGQLLSLQQQMQMSRATFSNSGLFGSRDLFVIAVALLAQLFLFIWFK